MKTIVWEEWMERSDEGVPRARRILSHFDVHLLRRDKKAPAVALRKRRARRAER